MQKLLLIITLVIGGIVISFYLRRNETKKYSPEATASYEKNGFKVSVVYCQPSKKNRVIFGGLVPFGAVWRTGANEATRIRFNRDMTFGGKPVSAGEYSLFTIPEEHEWIIILNKVSDQWGAFTYDEEEDVLRTKVKPTCLSTTVEMFAIDFNERQDTLFLHMGWEQTSVEVPLTLLK